MTSYTQFVSHLKSRGVTSGYKAAWVVRQARQSRPVIVDDLTRKRHGIPVELSQAELQVFRAAFPRISRWGSAENTAKRDRHKWTETRNRGQYSGRCRYAKIDHVPVIWSECWITTDGRYMVYQYGPSQRVIKAPKGWRWSVDSEGVRICNTTGDADYHPTSLDLLADNRGVRYCIEQARKNQAVRRGQAKAAKSAALAIKQQAAMLAKYPAYVCFCDSRKAGNCGAGTLSWMDKQGLPLTSHILANRIEKFQDARVTRVAQVATSRHIKEMQVGVCLLSDHIPGDSPQ